MDDWTLVSDSESESESSNFGDTHSIPVPIDAFLPNNGLLKYRYHFDVSDGNIESSKITKKFLKAMRNDVIEELYDLNYKKNYWDLSNESLVDTDICVPGAPPCRLVNLVCTYNTGLKLNPTKIALVFKHIIPLKYNIKGFAAMILEVKMYKVPSTTILLYPSGNVVHTGAKSIAHARLSAWTLALFFMKHLHIPLTIRNFKINNIVSNLDLPFPIELEPLNNSLGVLSSYQPEKIQCVFIRRKSQEHLVILVYASGSIVSTGCRSIEDVINQIKYIMEIVPKFRATGTRIAVISRHLHKKKGEEIPKICGSKRSISENPLDKPGVQIMNPLIGAFKKLKFIPN